MPGSRLKHKVLWRRKTLKQTFIMTFGDGDNIKYFVLRGVREGDRCVTRCDMVRVMNWDQLIDYLGDVWEEMWDAMLFKLKAAEASMS
jgi:hypothetical protein